MSDTLYVLAAAYDHVDDALAEYEAINVAHKHVGSTHDFDANVIAKGANGSVEIVRRHDAGKSHGAETGSDVGPRRGGRRGGAVPGRRHPRRARRRRRRGRRARRASRATRLAGCVART